MILRLRSEKRVNCMARKKIVFIIVEGISDETALGSVLSKIYDTNYVYLHVMHRDITTEKGVNASNIVAALGNTVRAYAKDNHFKFADFQEIIHIVDMDGAYISDEYVIMDDTRKNPLYDLTEIRSANPKGIILRNKQKRENLDRICGLHKIWNLPYHVYFMSCNLDHVLYDKQNSTNTEKENDSYAFALKYKNNPFSFISFIANSEFSLTMDYELSWDFIKQHLHSLERHTNFGLCFKDVKPSQDLPPPLKTKTEN